MLFHGLFLSNTWMFFLQMMYAILLYIPEIILFILNVFDILTRLIKFNVWKSCLDPGNNSAVLDRSIYAWRKTVFWEIGIFVSSHIELNARTLILWRKCIVCRRFDSLFYVHPVNIYYHGKKLYHESRPFKDVIYYAIIKTVIE